jgi:hypothetical protein
MKKQLCLPVLFFFLSAIVCISVKAQYTFIVQNPDGDPIRGAKLVTANKEPGFTDVNGELKYFVPNGYVTITADGYQKKTINVFGVKVGSEVLVNMARVAPETRALIIHVKNKKGKPIDGASILVMPGTSAETDVSGLARTTHKQLPGDYITVIVNADGYKSQQKEVLVGQNRKTFGGFGAVKSPEDEVDFILESAVGTRPLVVEVLNSKDNKPVNGASVTIKVMRSGAVSSATTKGEGEAGFTINIGDELRAMVKCKGYKEKWSDITSDLTTEGDNAERRFLIYLSKEKEEDDEADWNGTFTDNLYSTYRFSGSSSSVSASWTYAGLDFKGTGSLNSKKMEGNKATGTWNVQHEDDTKTGSRSGTFTLTLNGNTITGQLVENTPTWSYKPGYSAANVFSSMHKGSVWAINITRKK